MSRADPFYETETGNGYRIRLVPNGNHPWTLRLLVSRTRKPPPGDQRRRIEPVLDSDQAMALAKVLASWADAHPQAVELADRLRAQSFDPHAKRG